MHNPILRIFISATTQDLGSCRSAAKEELLTAGMLPVTQENFGPDYLTLGDFLRSEIAKCDAVICLIGHTCGAFPPDSTGHQRSYTQFEYDLAIEHQKPILVFLAAESYIPDNPLSEYQPERKLQRCHRERVIKAGHKWEVFSDQQDLRVRVARAIRRITDLFPRRPMFYRHLPKTPGYFAGRAREMNQLTKALTHPAPAVVAVVGMGGQGKTTLVHRALCELQTFPWATGFWCTAYRGGYTFDVFLDDVLAHLLKDNFDKRALPETSARVARLLSVVQQQPILLVVDGIERWLIGWGTDSLDPQSAETVRERTGFQEGLDDFLQQASGLMNGSHLVITTRALPAALDQAAHAHIPIRENDGEEIGLEGLDPVAATALLEELGVKGSAERLGEIAASHAYHPLALTILGTLLYKKYGGRPEQLPQVAAMDPSRELHRLFDEIRANLPGRERAERFLKVASQCIENPTLPAISAGVVDEEAAPSYAPGELLDDAVMLADWNLIGWDGATQAVTLHPLLKTYFASLLSPVECRSIHRRLSQWYDAAPIATNATLLGHMGNRILAIKHAIRSDDLRRAADLMFLPMVEVASLFSWLGDWGHQLFAIELLHEMVTQADGELRGIFLLAQTQMFEQLARSQLAAGAVEEAISIFSGPKVDRSRRVLANLAKCYATRGNILLETGDSALALPDFDRAIEIFETLGSEAAESSTDLATILTNRGSALRAIGALSAAIHDYGRAIDLWRDPSMESAEMDDLLLARILNDRGIAFLELGNVNGAIADFEKSIRIITQPRGIHDRRTLRDLLAAHAKSMLAMALIRFGRHSQAGDCVTEAAMALQEAVEAGRKDAEPSLALALVNHAEVLAAAGLWHNTLTELDKSVVMYQRLVVEAGSHFEAGLAHSLCARAAARHALGDWRGSNDDRRQGFATSRQLMRKWQSESEIQLAFLKDSLCALDYLLCHHIEDRTMEIAELLRDIKEFIVDRNTTEAVRSELLRCLPAIEEIIAKLEANSHDSSLIRKLKEVAKSFE